MKKLKVVTVCGENMFPIVCYFKNIFILKDMNRHVFGKKNINFMIN